MDRRACRSSDPKVFCAALAPLGIGLDLKGDLLAFGQARKPGALDGANMDENIVAAVIRRNEPKSLLAVEPLNCTRRHYFTSFYMRVVALPQLRTRRTF